MVSFPTSLKNNAEEFEENSVVFSKTVRVNGIMNNASANTDLQNTNAITVVL